MEEWVLPAHQQSLEFLVYQGTAKDIQLLQGGCLLNTTGLTAGNIIPAGTPVVYDETTRVASILHNAKAQAMLGQVSSTYPVEKGHSLVGDNLATGAVEEKHFQLQLLTLQMQVLTLLQ